MKIPVYILGPTLLLFSLQIAAAQPLAPCGPEREEVCTVNGQLGTRYCNGIRWSGCTVVKEPEATSVTGTLKPKYYVLALLYAPPGTSGGSQSSVNYASGSSMGSSVSISDTFKEENKLNVTVEAGVSSVVGDFSGSTSSTDESTLELKKSENTEINVLGPNQDGIDHDEDQFLLWLNPEVSVVIYTGGHGNDKTVWSLGTSSGSADLQLVKVAWLKDPSKMPGDLATRLDARKMGPSDFANILAIDPFATGSTNFDPLRFRQTPTTFPYEPLLTTLKLTVSNQSTSTSAQTSTQQTSVGVTISGGLNFADLYKLEVKESSTFTWTNTNKRSTSTGSTESATVVVGGPSSAWDGFSDIAVYVDTMYNTYAFLPAPISRIGLFGSLVDARGHGIPAREVLLVVNRPKVGRTVRRTFTDSKGEYHFYAAPVGTGFVQVGEVKQSVVVMQKKLFVPTIRLAQ